MTYYENEFENENENNILAKIMGVIVIVIVAVVVFSLLSFADSCIVTYNELVEVQEKVNEAQANVQAMMQRRLELVPDLVKTAQAAADHEEAIIEDIANARAALSSITESLSNMLKDGSDIQAIDETNNQLTKVIKSMIGIVEDYPTITASEQYTGLMAQLEGAVNRISIAREEYNARVKEYNLKVRQFPGNIVALIFDFERIEPFEADAEANNSSLVEFN